MPDTDTVVSALLFSNDGLIWVDFTIPIMTPATLGTLIDSKTAS